jgi:D-3-phosphoglycerate dehydrogenase / 2-oxoglutarate reductase
MERFKAIQVIKGAFPTLEWVPKRLEEAGINFAVMDCASKEDLVKCAGDAQIVWAYGGRRGVLEGEALKALPNCVAIVRSGSGTDNVDKPTATSLGILVANTPDAVSEPVADHAISLLFSLVRRVTFQDRRIRKGTWDSFSALSFRSYRGATLGLVGFGRIPRLIVGKLSGFQMHIVAFDPFVSAAEMQKLGVEKMELDQLLKTSDYVSVHTPLTPDTVNLIGERELKLMQPGALFVNTSRGSVVDQAALVKALEGHWIAGAGIDVLKDEPPDPANPLLAMDQVILTPHMGGHASTFPQELCEASVEAIIDISQGRMPASVVNPDVLSHCRVKGLRARA